MRVKFLPSGTEYEIKPNETVLDVAKRHGIYIKSICGGVPSCAECRVQIAEGDGNILPPNAEELSLIGSGYFIDRRRLACKVQCLGDIVIDLKDQVVKEHQEREGLSKRSMTSVNSDRFEEEHRIEPIDEEGASDE